MITPEQKKQMLADMEVAEYAFIPGLSNTNSLGLSLAAHVRTLLERWEDTDELIQELRRRGKEVCDPFDE